VKHRSLKSLKDGRGTQSDFILFSYKNQDMATKRSVINLFLPSSIDLNTGNLNPLKVGAALEKIIVYKQNLIAI
jgi:hypothetical protein